MANNVPGNLPLGEVDGEEEQLHEMPPAPQPNRKGVGKQDNVPPPPAPPLPPQPKRRNTGIWPMKGMLVL